MNLINSVAFPKMFSFMRWGLLGAICHKYIEYLLKVSFHLTSCPKNAKCHDKLAENWNIWLIVVLPKKLSLWGWPVVCLCPKYIDILIKSIYSTLQDVLKNGNYHEKWAKD